MISIASLSFNFDPIEDRIRLIGNMSNGQQRVDFWMTRRLVTRLLKASSGLIKQTSTQVNQVPVEHRPAMAQFEHDQAQQTQTVQQEANLTHDDYPADLLKRLDISFQEERYSLSFFVGGEETPYAQSILSYDEMHQILFWLHKGSLKLEWGVPEILFDTSTNTTQRLQ